MGMEPGTFWGLTPYQARLYVEAKRRDRLADAWYLAKMIRAQALPDLDEMLGAPAHQEEAKTPEAASAQLKAWFLNNYAAKIKAEPKEGHLNGG